ncbi:Type-1 restriction enzyme EcoKI specificity protein [Ensifer adhaerens]|nr:Type-1 restriction enzyme EcoKI specificity protein [Ensifer adhaerens]
MSRAVQDREIEWIGQVPDGWRLVPLKYVARFSGGGTPSRDRPDFWNGDIPWVSPKDMKTEVIVSAEEYITAAGVENSATIIQPPESLLLVVRSGILQHTIPVAVNKVPVALNQDMKALKFDEALCLPQFAFRWVQGFNDQLLLAWRKAGATVESIEHEYLAQTAIPLPPIEEQASIVAFLNRETAKIDALVDEQKRLIELLEEKRQAVISHAVTKGLNPNALMKDTGIEWLGEVPARWDTVALRYVCKVLKDGTHLPPPRVDDGIPLLSVRNIQNGLFDFLADDSMISLEDYAALCKSFTPEPGDVLLAIVGATLGKSAIIPSRMGPFHIQRSLAIFRLYESVLPDWLNNVFQSYGFQCALWQQVGYSAQPGIYLGALAQFKVPVPSVSEQRLICAHIADQTQHIDRLISESSLTVNLLQERRSALIAAAVTGKINVQGNRDVQHDRSDVRNAVGFEIVRRLAHRPTFGRVKLQKIVYLAETYAGLKELNGHYHREAAGPLDRQLIAEIETLLQRDGDVLIEQPEGRRGAVTYRFMGQRQTTEREDLGRVLGDRRERFEQVLSKIGELDTKGAEAVATLFAVWNDALLDQKAITDEGVITGFLTEWHPEKPLKFKRDELRIWLAWMRRNGIVPSGKGPRTEMGRLLL